MVRDESTEQNDAALVVEGMYHEKDVEMPADSERVHMTLDKGVVGR